MATRGLKKRRKTLHTCGLGRVSGIDQKVRKSRNVGHKVSSEVKVFKLDLKGSSAKTVEMKL